ncbi:MAG: FkbM family methyltransferase [Pirellulaceae bacterium]|nr:FkbM family methyltransferase [Pirellulaceae bacterium]
MTPLCFSRYVHTLRMAYRVRPVPNLDQTLIPYSAIEGKSQLDATRALLPGIAKRLNLLRKGLADALLPDPQVRTVELLGRPVYWPIVNQQGLEWYGASPLAACDFLQETELGLHENAQVIYDFGGHHGVWAQYYSMIVGPTRRVYSYEPSIVNIEVSALLLLLNSASNVVNFAMAIGAGGNPLEHRASMLVDFVDPNSLEIVDFRNTTWDYADFLKMDIEGYEYDLITANPHVFDLARHMHIEVHIPHLERRGLDYRKIINLIPFDKFEVYNHDRNHPVGRETPLEGFCGLLLKRKQN